MLDLLRRRWFLFGLLAAILFGLAAHSVAPVRQLASASWFRNALVAAVMFVMALPLEARAMWRAIRRPLAPAFATAINFGLIPPLAWLASLLLPRELALGVIVAGATPCTLASASVWTRKAGGNDAAAILVTIVTNVSCFLVTPLWVMWLVGQSTQADSLRLGPMVVKLATIVVAPMALAQLLRLRRSLGRWATERKTMLGVFAQSGILLMVALGSVRTGQRLMGQDGPSFSAAWLAAMAVLVLSIHLIAFSAGFFGGKPLGLAWEDRIAAGFAGSQKTLMVGLQVSMDLGVSILPMITYHVSQLLVDTLIADRLKQAGDGQADAAENKSRAPGRVRDPASAAPSEERS